MRDPLAAILQVILSVILVALALPLALAEIPMVRDGQIAVVASTALLSITFVVLRFLWPGKKPAR